MKTVSNEQIKASILESGVITEQQINLLKRRGINEAWLWDANPKLTADQNQKGVDFLRNKLYTPTGKERTSHTFGYREIEAINTFECFYFVGFYNAARYGQNPFLLPIYECCGKETTFQYYYDGAIHIIG